MLINEQLPLLSPAQRSQLNQWLGSPTGTPPAATVEAAGQRLAQLASMLLADDLCDRPLVILAGGGHKGSSAFVAARHLLAAEAWVQVVLTQPGDYYTGSAAQQLAALQSLDAPMAWAEEGWELPPADLIIDGLVGTGLRGAPHGKVRELIQLANSSMAPIVSLDLPSGLDVAGGQLYTPHIRAAATLALGLPSVGVALAAAQGALGELYLADIDIPPQLYAQLGLSVPLLLAQGGVIHLAKETLT